MLSKWQIGLGYYLIHKLFTTRFPSTKIVVRRTKGISSAATPSPLDNHNETFDDHLFRLGLSLSALIFLLLLEKDNWQLPFWFGIVILSLAALKFILPTFALMRLRFGRFPRVIFLSDKLWALFYVLLVNGPYLGINIYLYVLLEIPQKGKHYDASILAVKSVAMIYLAVKKVWTRLQYWRHKRNAMGSRGELTAPGATNDDEA